MIVSPTFTARPAAIRPARPAFEEAQEKQQRVEQIKSSLGALEGHLSRIDMQARDTEAELAAQQQALRRASSRTSTAFKTLIAGAGCAAIGAVVGQMIPGGYGLALTVVGALTMMGSGVVLTNNDVRRTEASIVSGGLSDRVKIYEDARLRTESHLEGKKEELGAAARDRDAALERVQVATTPVDGTIEVESGRVNIGGISIPRRA